LEQVIAVLYRWSPLRQRWPLVYLALGVVALALVGQALQAHLGDGDQSDNVEARELWVRTLRDTVPPSAVLVSNDRDEIMPVWYFQYVLGQRRDLTALFPLLTPELRFADIGSTIDVALSSGRPVYLNKPMPGLEVKYDLQAESPEQAVVHVLGPAPLSGQ